MDLLLRSALPLSVNLNCYATKVATHIKQLGQAQPVPVGQADWDRLCLSQWDRHAACTRPVPLGLGKVKRDLSPVPWTGHWHIPTMEAVPVRVPRTGSIPTLEACPCPVTDSIPTMESVPVQPVPTCLIKWEYKAVQIFT